MGCKKNLVLNLILKAKRLNPYNCRGQVVVIMLIIAMIIGIVIPGLIYLTQHEAKWTVKEVKSTRAFHLAEAGLDRGVFKLNESDVWDTAYAGTAISGYNGDIEYSDVEGGYYKIKFSTGSGDYEVTITASGKDKTTDEIRTIQAVYYSPPGAIGALNAPVITTTGHVRVHWGPIASLTNIELSGSTDVKYPRKYARTYIDPRYTSGPLPKFGSLTDEELAEWHCGYDVPDIPSVDFDYYQKKSTTVTGAPAGGSPAGSSYYTAYKQFKNLNETTERVYYCENGAQIQNSHLRGTLIVKGNLDFQGNDGGSSINAVIPANAWKEYQEYVTDTSATEQYPGDLGEQYSGDGTDTYDIGKVSFKGYIHVTGNVSFGSNNQINGVIICEGNASGNGTPTIWYDVNASTNIVVTSTNKPTRQSWKELSPRWDL